MELGKAFVNVHEDKYRGRQERASSRTGQYQHNYDTHQWLNSSEQLQQLKIIKILNKPTWSEFQRSTIDCACNVRRGNSMIWFWEIPISIIQGQDTAEEGGHSLCCQRGGWDDGANLLEMCPVTSNWNTVNTQNCLVMPWDYSPEYDAISLQQWCLWWQLVLWNYSCMIHVHYRSYSQR